MTVPMAPVTLAVASSPSGWALACPPDGAAITGNSMRCPSTVVDRSISLMSTSIRGRSMMESKTSRVLLRVISSVAPPAMKSDSVLGRRSLDRASNS